MSLDQAFGITEEDVETVMQNNAVHVANSQGLSFEVMASTIFGDWSSDIHDRIASAALAADAEPGADDEEILMTQTDAAHAEIRIILVEQGILKR